MASKEMLIVFVYDLHHCQNEADDPLHAINYFHPSWVSDVQKLALCGQLMGMMNFCSEFGLPEIISLQNGKFKINQFGRFILAIGTDRNVQESLLLHRATLMINILQLYHQDLNTIYEQVDQKNFSDKLYHIFETYLPILQYSGLLQNVYKLHLPNSASNIYLDAVQILEHIANKSGSLGGMILHNGKVIASQFSVNLTKILTATDPIRIKTSAETARNINFHIPMGSQIIKIYIKLSEYERLQKQIRKVSESTSLGIQNSLPLPFSIRKKSIKDSASSSMLKRDKSLIFTHIPEEEALVEIPIDDAPSKNFSRPTHLPLKFKTLPPKELPESGIASIVSYDESDSFPDFIGRTSVCATPMTENKILTGPISSIFAMDDNLQTPPVETPNTMETNKKKTKLEQIFINYTNNPFHLQRKSSWNDELDQICESEDSEESFKNYNVYNTITDPLYPIMNQKRQPLSKVLFDDYTKLFISSEESSFKPTTIAMSKPTKIHHEPANKSIAVSVAEDSMIMKRTDIKNSPNRIMRNNKKKMLKLPIKSFSLDLDSGKASTSTSNTMQNTASIFDSPSTKTKKYMGGLQLTPLMSKLTMLAMSENENFSSSGFSSFDLPTPNYCDTPIDHANRTLMSRLTKVDESKVESTSDVVKESTEMKRVDLFVCGQQNMTLMVIVDEDTCDHPMVQSIFEICVNRLCRMEQRLNDINNVTVDLKASEYGFINLDKAWEVTKRSGAWQKSDLQTLQLVHDHFSNKNISDVIIRNTDSVVYGHNKSAECEIYYQHAASQSSTTSDFMIVSQAKRRLERDHSLVLF